MVAVMKITLLNFHEEKCWNVFRISDGVSQPAAAVSRSDNRLRQRIQQSDGVYSTP